MDSNSCRRARKPARALDSCKDFWGLTNSWHFFGSNVVLEEFRFELQREDFQDDKEWNDHLEFIEDIIYRSVRGDAAEAAEGQKLMAEYRDRKQSLLYKVLSRKVSFDHTD